MKGIVEWLINMEQLAGNVYRKAANIFSENKEFSSFLSSLAEDEDLHFQLLNEAKQKLLEKTDQPRYEIIVDQSTMDQIKAPLQNLYEQIMSVHEISEETVMKVIIDAEFYELNDIFLYVFQSLYGEDRKIQNIVAIIHSHLDRINDFIDKHSHEMGFSDVIERLSLISKRRLLVVDDETVNKTLIAGSLKRLGTIETATNGKEALDKIKDSIFDVIISDIRMPVMDGMELFQKAREIDHDIGKRFVFCSGNITPEMETFLSKHHLVYLEKPFKVNQLIKAVQSVIGSDK